MAEKKLKVLCVGKCLADFEKLSEEHNYNVSLIKADSEFSLLETSEIDLVIFNEADTTISVEKLLSQLDKKKKSVSTIESKLKEAQAIAKLGSWELDIINNSLFWSDEVYKIFNLDKEKFGASYEAFVEFVHPDDRELVNRAYKNHLRYKKVYDVEHRILLENDVVKYVHENCHSEFNEEGDPIRSVGTIQDITNLKMTEIELEKHKNNLEELVKERTKELHKANLELKEKTEELEMFNKTMIDREMRIIELKEEVNNLSEKKMYPEIWNE